jgi:hypothetical protein
MATASELKRQRERLREFTDPAYAEKRKADRQRSSAKAKKAAIGRRPFEGCDGEGVKVTQADGSIRSEYHLFRMGERQLYTGKRLTTIELLTFILAHPPETELVGFAFEYDVSNILIDLEPEKMAHVLSEAKPGKGKAWTRLYVRGHPPIGVMWLPNNYLKVCRLQKKGSQVNAVPGSVRMIQDVFAFFQSAFVAAVSAAGLMSEAEYAAMAAMKADRAAFNVIDDEIMAYCADECRLLARLMEDFRDKVEHVEQLTGKKIRPRTWNGPGKMASSLFRQEEIMRREEAEKLLPIDLRGMAQAAYYGGRFEIGRIGFIDAPCYGHDINSAYPAAAQRLPCLAHGTWRVATATELTARFADPGDCSTFVAKARFFHPKTATWCGLPFRRKNPSRLTWPRQGCGVYWSVEIRSAVKLDAYIELQDGWLYEKAPHCDCRPFGALAYLYEARRQMGKTQAGRPLKLVVNSAYGKLAQRIGEAPYQNFIWAGLITAETRAQINLAIAEDPQSILMVATDGIYATRCLSLAAGDGLGQWDLSEHPEGLFLVKPGLYWNLIDRNDQRKIKSRGLSPRFFARCVSGFETAWSHTITAWQRGERPAAPFHPVQVEQFYSLRLAQARKDKTLACQWKEEERRITFEFRDKRQAGKLEGRSLRLDPLAGWPDEWSHVVVTATEAADFRNAFVMSELERAAQPQAPDLRMPMAN